MVDYRDWLFFIPAGLGIIFMIWVLFEVTEQLAGPEKAARRADAESERVCIVETAPAKETRVPAREL